MRRLRSILSIILILTTTFIYADKRIDSLLHTLDKDIEQYHVYEEKKLQRLKELMSTKISPSSPEQYALNTSIYNEYKSYSSDSAFHYLYKNLMLAKQLNNSYFEVETLLEEAYLLTCVGMYLEAKEILDSIDRSTLPQAFLGRYYRYYKQVYFETGVSLPRNKQTSPYYRKLGLNFRDSMIQVLSPKDDVYLSEKMFQAKENRHYHEALQWNDNRIKVTSFGEPLYALVAYDRSGILRAMGKEDEALYYLLLAAISDVRSAIRNQSSIMILAQILYERGDINRANNYINFSWRVTEAFNTRMRNWRHIMPYSKINSRFQEIISRQNTQLQSYLLLITVLSFLLGMALIYIYRQMINFKKAKERLQELNETLISVNNKLEEANNNLKEINGKLLESNKIKEVYISRFFKLCSDYIDRIHTHRKLVHKKLLKKEYSELLQKVADANEQLITDQQELYTHFDIAFLHLFPDFAQSVNQLLMPEERFVLKEGEHLNTELRICALIRLGFIKSAQIAELLHYSPTTIYNYRTRLREKALERELFEEQIMKIH